MGDSGEGLVDAEGRIQERMEELAREKREKNGKVKQDPETQRRLSSLKMARADMAKQLESTKHAARKAQLTQALEEIDRRIEKISSKA